MSGGGEHERSTLEVDDVDLQLITLIKDAKKKKKELFSFFICLSDILSINV